MKIWNINNNNNKYYNNKNIDKVIAQHVRALRILCISVCVCVVSLFFSLPTGATAILFLRRIEVMQQVIRAIRAWRAQLKQTMHNQ